MATKANVKKMTMDEYLAARAWGNASVGFYPNGVIARLTWKFPKDGAGRCYAHLCVIGSDEHPINLTVYVDGCGWDKVVGAMQEIFYALESPIEFKARYKFFETIGEVLGLGEVERESYGL
jgi:hypothetical protein